jgi:hypothetical protein
MGWAIGFDANWQRDIGYGVPAICDYPQCTEEIDRGLGYVCGGGTYGGENGCGLYFCGRHLHCGSYQACDRCEAGRPPYEPTPDTAEWLSWKLTDESWAQWCAENPAEVEQARAQLAALKPVSPGTTTEEG